MRELTITILDDVPSRGADIERNIKDALPEENQCEIVTRAGDDLREVLRNIITQKESFEEGAQRYDHLFDKTDILVVDYDLSELHDSAYMTGEDIAQLARLYSEVGPIVSVNRFGPAQFDLRLRSGSESWSDLSVAHQDLALSGLWLEEWSHEYRPWYWPVLNDLPKLYSKRVQSAKRHKRKSVLEMLDVPPITRQVMPDEIYDQLVDPGEINPIELAREIVPPRAPNLPDKQLVRIAASQIGNWLAQSVLSRQDVLIDAPHLVTMYPSLLEKRDSDTLEGVCAFGPDAELPIDSASIQRHRLNKGYWLDRPVWWTEGVLESDALQENVEPWSKEELNSVFAEDASQFYLKEECVRFDYEGLMKNRWVRRSDEMLDHTATYKPESRLIS